MIADSDSLIPIPCHGFLMVPHGFLGRSSQQMQRLLYCDLVAMFLHGEMFFMGAAVMTCRLRDMSRDVTGS